jgi:hypothetical protein
LAAICTLPNGESRRLAVIRILSSGTFRTQVTTILPGRSPWIGMVCGVASAHVRVGLKRRGPRCEFSG